MSFDRPLSIYINQHNTGAVYERIERVIVERPDDGDSDLHAGAEIADAGQKPWWSE